MSLIANELTKIHILTNLRWSVTEKFTQWPALSKGMFSREFIYNLIQYLQIRLGFHNYMHQSNSQFGKFLWLTSHVYEAVKAEE